MGRLSRKFGQFILIFALSIGWIFSGWPQILNFPPEIERAQAAISFVGSCSANGGNGVNATLTLPTALEGDLVIVAYQNGDDDNGNKDLVMVTAGYTEVADLFSDDSLETNLGVFRKFMESTPDTQAEADNISGSDSDTPAVCMVFRGVDTGTPMDVAATTASAANQGTFVTNPPSIDHLNPSGVWTVIAGANAHNLGSGTYTFPTGYTTDAIQILGNDTIDGSVGMGYRSSGGADPEDPGNMTYSGTDSTSFSWAATTMALRPARIPTVTTQDASSIGVTSATFNGTITNNNGATSTVRGFAWGTSATMVGDTATTTENGAFDIGAFTDSAQTLTCNTTYYYRPYAVNIAGTSTAPISTSFATSACPNSSPTLSVSQPDGTGDTVTAGDLYNITYTLADTDDTVTAAFYYDTEASGLDGTAISGACASAAEGTDATCSWNTTGVTPGSYYVYGITNDGTNPDVSDYSSGQITINSAAVYSVSITSSGVIEYGFVQIGNATSTVNNGYTQTAENDGNTTEQLNVKSSNATGGTSWTLASSIDTNQFKHEFSTTTGSTWTTMSTVDTYVTAAPSVAQSGTVNFDFRLTVPSTSSDYQQKSITITVQAVAP